MTEKKKFYNDTSKVSYGSYDFSEPVPYTTTHFGIEKEVVNIFTIDLNVAEMKNNFQIFEELKNVHEWPISKLIQRELDSKRASDICHDYLMMKGDLKYFPPLTAVLIPTENSSLPTDSYPEKTTKELDALNGKIIKAREAYKNYDDAKINAGGIYTVPYDSQRGDIIWDKNTISAVIIDGQHRYKALIEAANENKEFNECKVAINLIDLIPICDAENKGPTDVARNLFVTINNTPVEVDEARLVLMDDRDTLATFTQVLVDDSDSSNKPVVPAELIDWKCEGAKHDIEQSLTGVLTLRQVVQSSIFNNISISSIDDRQNRKKVRKWIDRLEAWTKVDEIIEKTIGKSESMQSKFELAAQELDDETDDSESPFLFSYSGAVAKVVMERFRELYLPVFRKTYNELSPYKTCLEKARGEGAFDRQTKLHGYLRAFAGKRKELLGDNATGKEIQKYKKSFKQITTNSIPHTVMGQKAIFKTLFTYYLSEEENFDHIEFLKLTNKFITEFNNVYGITTPSYYTDENIFNIKYRLKKAVEANKAGDLGREFWRGIILKHNGEIDYSQRAVDILVSVIYDFISLSSSDNSNDEEINIEKFEFSERDKIISRHQRIIKSFDDELSDETTKEIAIKIVSKKEELLVTVLGK